MTNPMIEALKRLARTVTTSGERIIQCREYPTHVDFSMARGINVRARDRKGTDNSPLSQFGKTDAVIHIAAKRKQWARTQAMMRGK